VPTMPDAVKPGDMVMPPERELRLWMRASLKEMGLPEDALLNRVLEVVPGFKVDKGGPWTLFRVLAGQAFTASYVAPYPKGREWTFCVRPTTAVYIAATLPPVAGSTEQEAISCEG